MTLQSIVDMARSDSLRARCAACAAQEGEADPNTWAQTYAWQLATQPGWADKWDSAKAGMTPQFNPDTGARPDVITDADILAAVQALRAATTA